MALFSNRQAKFVRWNATGKKFQKRLTTPFTVEFSIKMWHLTIKAWSMNVTCIGKNAVIQESITVWKLTLVRKGKLTVRDGLAFLITPAEEIYFYSSNTMPCYSPCNVIRTFQKSLEKSKEGTEVLYCILHPVQAHTNCRRWAPVMGSAIFCRPWMFAGLNFQLSKLIIWPHYRTSYGNRRHLAGWRCRSKGAKGLKDFPRQESRWSALSVYNSRCSSHVVSRVRGWVGSLRRVRIGGGQQFCWYHLKRL